jgi:hypothetical protein
MSSTPHRFFAAGLRRPAAGAGHTQGPSISFGASLISIARHRMLLPVWVESVGAPVSRCVGKVLDPSVTANQVLHATTVGAVEVLIIAGSLASIGEVLDPSIAANQVLDPTTIGAGHVLIVAGSLPSVGSVSRRPESGIG